jgi:sulfate transport system permease protein
VSYNEYDSVSAFAGASILAGLAIMTLILKTLLEWKQQSSRQSH